MFNLKNFFSGILGKIKIKDTTDATNANTASFITQGGAVITKNLRVYGDTYFEGTVNYAITPYTAILDTGTILSTDSPWGWQGFDGVDVIWDSDSAGGNGRSIKVITPGKNGYIGIFPIKNKNYIKLKISCRYKCINYVSGNVIAVTLNLGSNSANTLYLPTNSADTWTYREQTFTANLGSGSQLNLYNVGYFNGVCESVSIDGLCIQLQDEEGNWSDNLCPNPTFDLHYKTIGKSISALFAEKIRSQSILSNTLAEDRVITKDASMSVADLQDIVDNLPRNAKSDHFLTLELADGTHAWDSTLTFKNFTYPILFVGETVGVGIDQTSIITVAGAYTGINIIDCPNITMQFLKFINENASFSVLTSRVNYIKFYQNSFISSINSGSAIKLTDTLNAFISDTAVRLGHIFIQGEKSTIKTNNLNIDSGSLPNYIFYLVYCDLTKYQSTIQGNYADNLVKTSVL